VTLRHEDQGADKAAMIRLDERLRRIEELPLAGPGAHPGG